MIHIRNLSSSLTQSQLSLYAWELVQKTQMNGCPEDVQFHISVQTFLWKFNAALLLRKVSTLSYGWVVLSERQEGWARLAALSKQRRLKGLRQHEYAAEVSEPKSPGAFASAGLNGAKCNWKNIPVILNLPASLMASDVELHWDAEWFQRNLQHQERFSRNN